MDEITLEELYLELLASTGPGVNNRNNLEFWDPTLDAIVIFEELMEEPESYELRDC